MSAIVKICSAAPKGCTSRNPTVATVVTGVLVQGIQQGEPEQQVADGPHEEHHGQRGDGTGEASPVAHARRLGRRHLAADRSSGRSRDRPSSISDGPAGAKGTPWARSHPSARSWSSWPALSTPSATTPASRNAFSPDIAEFDASMSTHSVTSPAQHALGPESADGPGAEVLVEHLDPIPAVVLAEVARDVVDRRLRSRASAGEGTARNDVSGHAGRRGSPTDRRLCPSVETAVTAADRTTGVPMVRETLLARALVDFADTLVDDFDVVELLDHDSPTIRRGARDRGRRPLVVRPGALRVMASSSDTVRILEVQELAVEEGPGFDCFHGAGPVVNQVLEAPGRWPSFGPDGIRRRLPVGARLADAFAGHGDRGADPARRGQRDDRRRHRGRPGPGGHRRSPSSRRRGGVGGPTAERSAHPHAATNSRVVIEQAKGMVAERRGLDLDQAFALLRSYARDHDVRLADLASDIIDGKVAFESLSR